MPALVVFMFSFHSHSFSSALFRFRSDVMHDLTYEVFVTVGKLQLASAANLSSAAV